MQSAKLLMRCVILSLEGMSLADSFLSRSLLASCTTTSLWSSSRLALARKPT